MADIVYLPGARHRVLLAAWKEHEAGWCSVANASRRGLRSWARLDRGANRQGFALLAVAAVFEIDPATVRIDPPEADTALLRFKSSTMTPRRPRTLEPHERAACARYWRERMGLLARLEEAVRSARPGWHRGWALREIGRERRLTAGILAEMGVEKECAA